MTDPTWRVIEADCNEAMQGMDEASVDAVVTDPPYGLEFMGKEWDRFKVGRSEAYSSGGSIDAEAIARQSGNGGAGPSYVNRPAKRCANCGKQAWSGSPCQCPEPRWELDNSPLHAAQLWHHAWATEALRVLKPGGHLLAFGGTRTYHRLACALEDAGFEIRDCIAWMYGSGFPKSLDVSKAIDKAAGAEREVYAVQERTPRVTEGATFSQADKAERFVYSHPATPDAERWQGWGTALKPSHEPVVVARKPVGMSEVLATIGSQLDGLEEAWQAQEAAQRTPTGAAGGSSDQTATSPSESAAPTSSSIVSSWRTCWAECCDLMSTSTTATTTSATTDLRTLSSCLVAITDASTQAHPSPIPTESSLVSVVDHLFAATVLSLRGTHALSALGLATANTPHSLREGLEPAPNFEPIVVARKPLAERNVAANVLRYGTGALNVDGCRIEGSPEPTRFDPAKHGHEGWRMDATGAETAANTNPAGRWPANVTLDTEAAAMLDEQTGETTSLGGSRGAGGQNGRYHPLAAQPDFQPGYGDTGGASRFLYVAKASREERERGLYGMSPHHCKVTAWDGSGTPTDAPPPRATDADTEGDDSASSTTGSGSRPTVPSPTESRSTTGTATRPTTGSTTSKPSPPPSTSADTPPTTGQLTLDGSAGAASAASGSRRRRSTSTSHVRGGSSTGGAGRVTSPESLATSAAEGRCPSCGEVVRGRVANSHPT